MIVSDSIFDALKWIGLLAGFIMAIGLKVTPDHEKRKFWGFLLGASFSLFVAFGLKHLGSPIVIVKMTESAPAEKTKGVLFFSRSYTFQDGHTARLAGVERTLVVNDSTRTLTMRSVAYGSIGIHSGPEPIAPMSTYTAQWGVDHVGPDDAPPDKVSSKISFDIRHWVTW